MAGIGVVELASTETGQGQIGVAVGTNIDEMSQLARGGRRQSAQMLMDGRVDLPLSWNDQEPLFTD